jgi:hypothetical protein
MRRYALQGTPTLLLIDAAGRLRRQTFGHVSDLQLGAEIMSLIREASSDAREMRQDVATGDRCGIGEGAC